MAGTDSTGGAGTDSTGEALLADYLAERGLQYQREPLVGGRNPDYVVDLPDFGKIALEVYEPIVELHPIEGLPGGAGVFDSVKPITNLFKGRKQKQTKAAQSEGLPFVAVIGSDASLIPFNAFSVLSAMYGRQGVALPLDGSDASTVLLGGAKVQRDRGTGVSAIALLHRFHPTEARVHEAWRAHGIDPDSPPDTPRSRDELVAEIKRMRELEVELIEAGKHDPDLVYARLSIFHNPWAVHPLPAVFAGPYDEQHGVIDRRPDRLVLGPMASGVFIRDVVRRF